MTGALGLYLWGGSADAEEVHAAKRRLLRFPRPPLPRGNLHRTQ